MAYSLKENLMKEDRLSGGHRMCAGCGSPIAVRTVLRALDPEDKAVVCSATSCLEVSTFMYPYTAWKDSFIHNAFENAAATISGVETAYRAMKKRGKIDDTYKFIAFGGDGTLNEVTEGVWLSKNPHAEIACVPCGSGNDFIRNFGTQSDFLNLDALIRGHAVVIDLMRTHRGVSAAICSVGIDADIAYGIPRFRRVPLCGGHMAYNLSILQRLCGKMGRRMLVDLDGRRMEETLLIATVCNGSYYGGGFCAAPQADLHDGLLDVILVKKISRVHLAGVLAKYKKGEHIDGTEVAAPYRSIMQHYRARHVRIQPCDGKSAIVNADGECRREKMLDVQALERAAAFVLPEHLCEKSKVTAQKASF